MKKLFFSSLLLGGLSLPAVVTAQTSETVPYQYSHDEAPYVYLSENAIQLLGNTGWDDDMVPFTLPFEFQYQGESINSWIMDTYGGLYPNGFNLDQDVPGILGIYSDYMDNGNSSVNLEITGEEGSRIAKIEFRNVGFFSGEPEADSANFQIWLYEGSNKIEYHVGPNNVNSLILVPDGGILIVGLNYAIPDDSIYLHVVNYNENTNTDTLLKFNLNEEEDPSEEFFNAIVYGSQFPQEGTVFRFEPTLSEDTVGIQPIPKLVGAISPNPTSDVLTLQLVQHPAANAALTVYNIAGRKLLHQPVTDRISQIDVKAIPAGVYFLRYSEGDISQSIRFIKR